MFHNLAAPSQQLIAVNRLLTAPVSALGARRNLAGIRCRVAAVEDLAGCQVASRNRMKSSLYEVLRVTQNASPVDIKKAYRRLAKQYHPDAAGAAAAAEDLADGRDFIQIQSAYATLSDPKSRDAYDRWIGAGGRRPLGTRSAAWTTSFGGYSSSPRSPVNRGRGFYPTRRWESDQCW